MLKGKVVGAIVSTNKFDALRGFKLLEVQLIENKTLTDQYIIAVDQTISAGIGEGATGYDFSTDASSIAAALESALRSSLPEGMFNDLGTAAVGVGEEVLIVTGSSARVAVGNPNAPVDAVVAGVIDKLQN